MSSLYTYNSPSAVSVHTNEVNMRREWRLYGWYKQAYEFCRETVHRLYKSVECYMLARVLKVSFATVILRLFQSETAVVCINFEDHN